jgi:hypothetical protein
LQIAAALDWQCRHPVRQRRSPWHLVAIAGIAIATGWSAHASGEASANLEVRVTVRPSCSIDTRRMMAGTAQMPLLRCTRQAFPGPRPRIDAGSISTSMRPSPSPAAPTRRVTVEF